MCVCVCVMNRVNIMHMKRAVHQNHRSCEIRTVLGSQDMGDRDDTGTRCNDHLAFAVEILDGSLQKRINIELLCNVVTSGE